MPTSVIDRPLNGDNEKDLFDIDGYQRALVEFIKGAEAPLTIALQGEWGSGKTSLMNYLKANLTQDNAPYYAIEINTWHYSMLCTPDQAIVDILRSILEQMGKKSLLKKDGKEVFKAISGKLLTFATTASLNVFGQTFGVRNVGTGMFDAYKSCKNEVSGIAINDILPASSIIEDLKADIQKAINEIFPTADNDKNAPRGFLFFIDDLDRIDPPVAVKILELLKNIFDLPRCIFVLAIDYNVVVKGLKSKFGELTAKNEREFRSFFDKIIQLPFSMPIASYKIDDFLTEKLVNIGFLDDSDKNNSKLKTDLTEFAQWSVGSNPRSLKRLMNTLSLIRLITEKTVCKQDDNDLKNYKVLNFALVCIQNTYPVIYNALLFEPDFREWDDDIVQKFSLPELPKEVADRLDKIEEFNERWEKILFRICNNEYFLSQRALEISNMLNKIIEIIPEGKNLGDCLSQVMRLSSVTNVQATEQQQNISNTDFHKSTWLKAYRDRLLPIVNQKLPEAEKVICTNDRVRTTLYFRYQKDNAILVDWINFSLTYDNAKKQFAANWNCGFQVFKGSATTDWDTAEREIGQTGAWNKIKSNFQNLQNEYKADHDMSKSLNIGCGGSYVWFKLYCDSLEEMISSTVIERHANFFVKFLQIAAEFKKLENTPLFEKYFFGLKKHYTEKGYAPFTNLWVYQWHSLVIDRFLYNGNVLSLDMIFNLNGFEAQFWVREGDTKIKEEVLDKTDLRKEFPDIVDDRCIKQLSHEEAIPFVAKVINSLKSLSC